MKVPFFIPLKSSKISDYFSCMSLFELLFLQPYKSEDFQAKYFEGSTFKVNCIKNEKKSMQISADRSIESLACGREGLKPDQIYNLLS